MLQRIQKWWAGGKLSNFDGSLTRERLIQGSRLVVIDDESPLLIEELRKEGFAVDHDTSGSDLHNLENQIYDVAILDYHGVGKRLGNAHGFGLLKHIRRVSPRTRIIAYTSRSLNASESEFFRVSHAVLPKDMGLGDSLALVESELKKALSKEHLFEALLVKINISDAEERERLRTTLVKALERKQESGFKDVIVKIAGKTGEKAAELIIKHLFQT
jgi:DNA-binding NtrC family response regulator